MITPPIDQPWPVFEPTDPASIKSRAAIARAAAGELLGPADIQAIWKIGKSQFQRLNRIHAFDHFRVHPPLGPKCFSGALITRYLAGELIGPSTSRLRNRRDR